MSLKYGPRIVSNGLVSYYDPSNSECYTAGSNMVYDLVDNSRSGSLYSGVDYSNISKGAFEFDGSANALIEVPPLENIEDFTISIWFRIIGSGDVGSSLYSTLIGNLFGGDNRLLVHNTLPNRPITVDFATPDGITLVNSTSSFDEWNNAVFTYNNTTGTGSAYVNNILSPTSIEDSNISFDNNMHWLGGSSNPISNYSMKGYISNCLIYNRELSLNEVDKNYNALKTKFSL